MFESFSAVILLIVFLVPGFVWRTVEGQFVYLDKRLEWEKFAFGLLARSTFVYLPFSPLILKGYTEKWVELHPLWVSVSAFGLLAIVPGVWAVLSGVARQKNWGRTLIHLLRLKTFEQHHIPTAWDFIFSTIRPAWIVVTLKNGNRVRGFLSPTSYISSDPQERDLYISHLVQPTEEGFKIAENTGGVYIRAEEVSVIEFTIAET